MDIDILSHLTVTRYYKKQVAVCPLCGEKKPNWKVFKFMGVGSVYRYAARCQNCKGLLSLQGSDLSGSLDVNLGWFLFTRFWHRKSLGEPYIMIENVGLVNANGLGRRSEYKIVELREMVARK